MLMVGDLTEKYIRCIMHVIPSHDFNVYAKAVRVTTQQVRLSDDKHFLQLLIFLSPTSELCVSGQ